VRRRLNLWQNSEVSIEKFTDIEAEKEESQKTRLAN